MLNSIPRLLSTCTAPQGCLQNIGYKWTMAPFVPFFTTLVTPLRSKWDGRFFSLAECSKVACQKKNRGRLPVYTGGQVRANPYLYMVRPTWQQHSVSNKRNGCVSCLLCAVFKSTARCRIRPPIDFFSK